MQRYQRQRHRLIWLVLVVTVPVVLAFGLLNRKKPKDAEEAPGGAQTPSFKLPSDGASE